MNKRQKLITDSNRNTFQRYVNEHLADGWTVVPGTLVSSIAAGSYSQYNYIGSEERWAVVVEQEVKE